MAVFTFPAKGDWRFLHLPRGRALFRMDEGCKCELMAIEYSQRGASLEELPLGMVLGWNIIADPEPRDFEITQRGLFVPADGEEEEAILKKAKDWHEQRERLRFLGALEPMEYMEKTKI